MPKNNLKTVLVPVDMILGQAPRNLDYITNVIDRVDKDTDLVVLPEMCTTGYTLDPELVHEFAETIDGPSMTILKTIAAEKNIGICGTFACREDGKYYNRGFFIDPAKSDVVYYDKRHLFSVGREDMLYTRGYELPKIIEFRGWKLQMCICYDLRFPVWCRNVDCGYDVLIIPANWPNARSFAWKHLLIARAIENQAYVCGCNRLGEDPYGSYTHELSYIFNHWGDNISGRDKQGIIYATLNGPLLEKDRLRFGPWRDADRFSVLVD